MPSDPCIIESLKHKCFLEELLFWTIKYEFPQKMVTFLLNMLPDQDYKVFFSSLVGNYLLFVIICSNTLVLFNFLLFIVVAVAFAVKYVFCS